MKDVKQNHPADNFKGYKDIFETYVKLYTDRAINNGDVIQVPVIYLESALSALMSIIDLNDKSIEELKSCFCDSIDELWMSAKHGGDYIS